MRLYDEPVPIDLEDANLLVNNTFHPPRVRTAQQMLDVVAARFSIRNPTQEMYRMFRGVHTQGALRYDITVVAPFLYGNEYAKTYGHTHPLAEDGMTYPEVYQVLRGQAAFVLQKKNRDESVNVLVVKATPGEILLIPPNYGHVSINLSTEAPLVLANIVAATFASEYGEYKQNRGAAIYYTTDGMVHNTQYLVRKVERPRPHILARKYGFICEDLFKEFYASPEKFEFLNKPSLMFLPED